MDGALEPGGGRLPDEAVCRALLARSLRLEKVAAAYGCLSPAEAAGLAGWRRRLRRGECDHSLELRDSLAWKVAERVLFAPGRVRRLPTRAEMLDVISIDGLQRSRLDGRGPWPALFFLPTVEWVRAMVRLIRRLGVARPLEVGCGDGFVARCLREAGCPMAACDLAQGDFFIKRYDEAIIRAEAVEAAASLRADFILWLWPPLGSPDVERLIELPQVRYYCEAGEPGERSGNLAAYARFAHRRQPVLSRLGFSPSDRSDDEAGLILCNHQYLFFGRAHARFARYEVTFGAEGPRRGERLVELQVEGMTCAHCEQAVKRALEALPHVREAVVSAAAGNAALKVEAGKVDRQAMAKAIAEAGYRLKGVESSLVDLAAVGLLP